MRTDRSPWIRLGVVAIYATAMAVVEATVVYYLRKLFALQYAAVFVAGHFNFPSGYLRYEQARELATIVMLLAVACLAGRDLWQKLAYFLFAFGVWDIGYYVFLKIMLDWPASLTTRDLLFLMPTQWWAPVWQPLLTSCVFVAVAVLLLARTQRR